MGIGYIFNQTGQGITISDVTGSSLGSAASFLYFQADLLKRVG